MDKLWAPWRGKYVTQILKKQKGCVFCKILKEKNDTKNLVLIRTELSFVVFNIYPYSNGHLLVIPNRHVNDLSKLTRAEREDVMDLVEETKLLLDNTLKPDGYNIGINLGRAAGAGFPGHLHVHIVPRWRGDVNFMPVVADTKVISQSMKELFVQLKNAHKRRLRRTRK